MQNTNPLTPADALQELQRLLKDDTDQVPEGWYTIKQLEGIWQKANATASKLAKSMVANGLAETRRFRIDTGAFVKPVPHFRFHARDMAQKHPASLAS